MKMEAQRPPRAPSAPGVAKMSSAFRHSGGFGLPFGSHFLMEICFFGHRFLDDFLDGFVDGFGQLLDLIVEGFGR